MLYINVIHVQCEFPSLSHTTSLALGRAFHPPNGGLKRIAVCEQAFHRFQLLQISGRKMAECPEAVLSFTRTHQPEDVDPIVELSQ